MRPGHASTGPRSAAPDFFNSQQPKQGRQIFLSCHAGPLDGAAAAARGVLAPAVFVAVVLAATAKIDDMADIVRPDVITRCVMAPLESLKAQKASGFRGRVIYDHLAALYALAGAAARTSEFCGHGFKHGLGLSGFAIAGRYPGRVGDKKR